MGLEKNTKIGKIGFGTLYEVNSQNNWGNQSGRVDMVLFATSPQDFSTVITTSDEFNHFVLNPNGVGTSCADYIAAIFAEKVNLRQVVDGWKRGMELYNPGVRLDLSIIQMFQKYSDLPEIEVEYISLT